MPPGRQTSGWAAAAGGTDGTDVWGEGSVQHREGGPCGSGGKRESGQERGREARSGSAPRDPALCPARPPPSFLPGRSGGWARGAPPQADARGSPGGRKLEWEGDGKPAVSVLRGLVPRRDPAATRPRFRDARALGQSALLAADWRRRSGPGGRGSGARPGSSSAHPGRHGGGARAGERPRWPAGRVPATR